MTDSIDLIKKSLLDIEDQKKELVEKLRPALMELFSDFFKEYPNLMFEWQQYTPSFNDGAPCEFTMGDIHVVA